MNSLKNLKPILLLLTVLMCIAFTQSAAIAQNVLFVARIDWGDPVDADDDNCTMNLTTRNFLGEVVDISPMLPVGNPDANGITTWEVWFSPSSTSVTWEVEVEPAARFPVNLIVDGDGVNFIGANTLDDDFIPAD